MVEAEGGDAVGPGAHPWEEVLCGVDGPLAQRLGHLLCGHLQLDSVRQAALCPLCLLLHRLRFLRLQKKTHTQKPITCSRKVESVEGCRRRAKNHLFSESRLLSLCLCLRLVQNEGA